MALVDGRGVLGGGASRSAGVVTVQLEDERDVALVKRSIELISEVSSRGVLRTGFLQIGRPDLLEDSIEAMRRCGIRLRTFDPSEVREVWPSLEVNEAEIGIYTSEDLSVEPRVLSGELEGVLRDAGVMLMDGFVRSFEVDGKSLDAAVLDGGRRVEGSEFVLSAGPWNRELLGSLHLELETVVITCYAYRFDLERDLGLPSFSDEDLHSYWRPWGTELIGGGYHGELGNGAPDMSCKDPPSSLIEESRDLLKRRVRISREPIYSGSTRGPCEITPDWEPYLGRVEHFENLLLAGGLRGYGLMRGPALGEMAYELLRNETISFDLKGYEPERIVRPSLESKTPR